MFKIQAQNPGDAVIDWFQNTIQWTVTNAQTLFDYSIGLAIIILVLIWLRFGLKTYQDFQKRYVFKNNLYYIPVAIIAFLLGPIGLLIYNILKPDLSKEDLDFIKVEHKFYYNQSSKVSDCIKCGAYVLEGHAYCTNCGTQNRLKCSKCGALTDHDDLYCFNCGLDFRARRDKFLEQFKKANNKDQNKNSNQKNKQNNQKEGPKARSQFNYFRNLPNQAKEKLSSLKEKSRSALKNSSQKVQGVLKKATNAIPKKK